MSALEDEIKKLVKETVIEIIDLPQPELPELISIKEAAEICSVARPVIDSLIHGAPKNKFPAIRFGKQTIKIDRRRLYQWIKDGGLIGQE